ncbi:MAG: hypothetical protein ACLPYZ_03555 [Limisphaerales bacterium]
MKQKAIQHRTLAGIHREPAVISRGPGSRGFFDEDGNSLPVIGVFDKDTRPERPTVND